jgi:predicted membrane-bound spermidine synthase
MSIWLALVFFFSGIAALIYQVVWQRALFAICGLDIISITVVVTAFMLGLGVGSLTGGAISRRFPHAAVPLFGAFEICIGLYGYKSLNLFRLAASATRGLGHTATGTVVFALVLVPTTLMGATLPLLVGYRASRSGNVGRSVGTLYFVNTLGAAAGACVTVESLLARFGASGSVAVSAALNVGLGLAVMATGLVTRARGAR